MAHLLMMHGDAVYTNSVEGVQKWGLDVRRVAPSNHLHHRCGVTWCMYGLYISRIHMDIDSWGALLES
jgi:hypothetical protein